MNYGIKNKTLQFDNVIVKIKSLTFSDIAMLGPEAPKQIGVSTGEETLSRGIVSPLEWKRHPGEIDAGIATSILKEIQELTFKDAPKEYNPSSRDYTQKEEACDCAEVPVKLRAYPTSMGKGNGS